MPTLGGLLGDLRSQQEERLKLTLANALYRDGGLLGGVNPAPVNASLFLKSMINPSDVNADAFSRPELSAIRNASINSNYRYNNNKGQSGDEYRSTLAKLLNVSPDQEVRDSQGFSVPAGELATEMKGKLSNSLQYSDYVSPSMDKYDSIAAVPVTNSFKDPGLAIALALGRANYTRDQFGNLHVKDVYDFPGAKETQSMPLQNRLSRLFNRGSNYGWNPTFGLLHTVGEQFSKPMNVDVQIQHGASGKW
jgi:hypothetical protein